MTSELFGIESVLGGDLLVSNPGHREDYELVRSFMRLRSRPNRPVGRPGVLRGLSDFAHARSKLPVGFFRPFHVLLELVGSAPIRVEPDLGAIGEWNHEEFVPSVVESVSKSLDDLENPRLIATLVWAFANLERERVPSPQDWADIAVIAVPGSRGYGRAAEAFRAYLRSGGHAKLVMLGRSPYYDRSSTDSGLTEAEANAAYLRLLGVPANRICIEAKSQDTRENVRYLFTILEEVGHDARDGNQKLLLITSNYHLARYRLHVELKAEAKGAGTEVFAMGARAGRYWAETYFLTDPKLGYTREEAMELVFNEYLKIAYGLCTDSGESIGR